jgi:nicotinamide-nucleotide amidase
MFVQTRGACRLFYVPGVPREYRWLVEHEVLPRLIAALDAKGPRPVRVLKLLKTVDLPESHLDQRVRPLFEKHPLVTFGFRTHAPENHLKLLAEAPTRAEAEAALRAAEAASRAVLGRHVFAVDDETMASVVLAALREKKSTLSVAESCTGGLVSAALTEIPGSSESFSGGAIVYTEALKQAFADVPAKTLAEHTAVSEETALAMAEGIRHRTGATFGLSITGYAGPGGGDTKHPVGTVFLGLAGPKGATVEHHHFHGDRQRVRSFATHSALDLVRRTLQEGSLT